MTFEADLKKHLQDDTGIAALVGDRITPEVVEGDTLPAITFAEISSEPQTDLSGGDGSLVRYRMQINVWAAKRIDAQALAELVRVRMQTAASTFRAVPEPSSQSVYEPDTKRRGHIRDYSCWYRTT